MDVLTVIFFFFFLKPELLIPSGALPEVVWRESRSKSGCKSPGLTLSHRQTPVGHMILYISARPLSSGTSPSLRISSALTHGKTSSSLSPVESLCQNIQNTKFYFSHPVLINYLIYWMISDAAVRLPRWITSNKLCLQFNKITILKEPLGLFSPLVVLWSILFLINVSLLRLHTGHTAHIWLMLLLLTDSWTKNKKKETRN